MSPKEPVLRGRRVLRAWVVVVDWGYEYREWGYSDHAKSSGFTFVESKRHWRRRYIDGKAAVEEAKSWNELEGTRVELRISTRESYCAPPPPWSALERLRRRKTSIDWWFGGTNLLTHLCDVAEVRDVLGDRIPLRYQPDDLHRDLKSRSIPEQPDAVDDLTSFILCADQPDVETFRPPADADMEAISEYIDVITSLVTGLRSDANKLNRKKKKLEKALLAAAVAAEPRTIGGEELSSTTDIDAAAEDGPVS